MAMRTCGRELVPVHLDDTWLEAEGFMLVAATRAFAGYTPNQRELIEQATAKSLANVGKYTQALHSKSLKMLDHAGQAIHASILSLGDLSQFTAQQLPGKTVELARLKAVQKSIKQTGEKLSKDLKLLYKGVTKDMATSGIEGVIDKLGAVKLPGYKDLAPHMKSNIAAGAFSMVNTQAFDFLNGYQLQLLGKLSDDLVAKVHQVISVGIVRGQSPAQMARVIGWIVDDPAEFRKAGKTVFKSVQQRAELIARSETMRAYNQGAIKFEKQIGVVKLTWLTAGDERTCPECGPLDGREYRIEKMPSQPLHPACRCTHVPAPGGLNQIQDLESLQKGINKHHLAQKVVKDATKSGDYHKLTVVQLRELAKSKGVSIARTKAERLAILADSSDMNLSQLQQLTMKQLNPLFKQYKVGALKTHDDLVKALLQADAGVDAAKIAAQQAAQKAAKEAAEKAKKAAELAAAKAKALEKASTEFHGNLAALKETADPEKFLDYSASKDKIMAHLGGAVDILGPERMKQFTGMVNDVLTKFSEVVNTMPQKQLREILKANKVKNFQWYTKGETVEYILIPAKRDELIAQVAAKVQAVKDAKKLKKAVPKPAPKPKLIPKKSVIAQAQDADEAWEAFTAKDPFKYHSDARSLGGAHSKYFFTDPDGNKWLFKPIDEEFRAWGDEVAYRIHREIDPNAVEVRFIELKVNGRKVKGSIQPMKPGLRKPADYSGVNLAGLEADELAQLQREHVVDWLMSNHDGHAAQFLRATDGSVYGIDKGQLYKYFGKDKLSITYHPNKPWGAGEPIYNTMMRMHRDGVLKLDLQATEEFIRRAEAITDDAFRQMLKPYAERRFVGQPGALEDFLQAAVKRKNRMRQDFKKFYSEIETERTGKKVKFKFDGKSSKQTTPVKDAAPEEVIARDTRIDLKQEAKDAQENAWQGKSIPVDKDQIEDQNVLIRERVTVSGKRQTVMTLRLRPDADKTLVKVLKKNSTKAVADTAFEDKYWDQILAAAKTVNHHLDPGDLSFNDGTLKEMFETATELRRLKRSGNFIEKKMAKKYLDIIGEIDGKAAAARNGKSVTKLPIYKPFEATPADLKKFKASLKTDKPKALNVTQRASWTEDRVRPDGNRLIVEKENVPLNQHHGSITSKTPEYEIDLGDGVRAVYKPFQGTQKNYALQGRMTVKIEGAVSDRAVAQALEKLKKLGLDASVASEFDEELMYLQKVAYVAKVDKTPAFMQATKRAADANSPEAAVKIWREAWSTHLGVADVTKLPDYKPQGTFQMATAGKTIRAGGTRIQHRFDISEAVMKKQMKDYVLTHSLTGGMDMESFFDVVLGTNRSFMPTADRFATGVPIGGMSPGADMNSGGASYFFTRIRKRTSPDARGMIRLKSDLLRRSDAISYPNDKYGNVTGTNVRDYRASTISEMRRYSRNCGNETIFKGPVTILDNLDSISVSSNAERQRLIKVFTKHGVLKLPDGRSISKVIVVE